MKGISDPRNTHRFLGPFSPDLPYKENFTGMKRMKGIRKMK
jgi:hypothetical protein